MGEVCGVIRTQEAHIILKERSQDREMVLLGGFKC